MKEKLNALNATVAEKVMGWKKVHGSFRIGEFVVVHDGTVLTTTNDGLHEFNPAESPADAMAVLKKCSIKAGRITLDAAGDGTLFALTVYLANGKFISESGSTLETAICQFAVKLFQ